MDDPASKALLAMLLRKRPYTRNGGVLERGEFDDVCDAVPAFGEAAGFRAFYMKSSADGYPGRYWLTQEEAEAISEPYADQNEVRITTRAYAHHVNEVLAKRRDAMQRGVLL